MLTLVAVLGIAYPHAVDPVSDGSIQRTNRLSRQQAVAAKAAGAVGAGLGWAIMPRLTPRDAGTVRTAEAWRRRVNSRQKIPITTRSLQVCVIGLASFSLAEYLLLSKAHGLRNGLAYTSLGSAACTAFEAASRATTSIYQSPLLQAARKYPALNFRSLSSQSNSL